MHGVKCSWLTFAEHTLRAHLSIGFQGASSGRDTLPPLECTVWWSDGRVNEWWVEGRRVMQWSEHRLWVWAVLGSNFSSVIYSPNTLYMFSLPRPQFLQSSWLVPQGREGLVNG